VKAKCNRCWKELDRIRFLEPDWEGICERGFGRRPPLCEDCWKLADAEAVLSHGGSH